MMIKTWLPKRYFHILLDMILALAYIYFRETSLLLILYIIHNPLRQSDTNTTVKDKKTTNY
jgi:hypothetical protein